MPPTVSMLIITYNSSAVLSACLDSIAATTSCAHELIIVDNASTDGTPELVRTQYPGVILIDNHQNTGFAVATNQAARQAQGRYLLLLNPDTVVQSGVVDRLVAFMDSYSQVGIAAPRVANAQGQAASNTQEFHTAGTLFWRTLRSSPLEQLARHMLARHTGAEKSGVVAVYGCALQIRADLFHSVGGLDERFFLYEEDIDLCYRVHRLGYDIRQAPDITIVHYGGQSSSHTDTSQAQQQVVTFAHRLRSRSLYACKHFSRRAVLGLHIGYVLIGLGLRLFSLLHNDRIVRSRRRVIGGHYLHVGVRGLR